MIARPGSCADGSIMLTVPKAGIPAGVTFFQFAPLSLETCTTPSSLPAHSRPLEIGDSSKANIVPKTSIPVLSLLIGPPE